MIDPFVILAPLLLLAVIALLRFVGCDVLFRLEPVKPHAPTLNPSTFYVANAQVTLSWEPEGDSYNVKRATMPGGPYSTIASKVQATNFTDTPPPENFFYYYVVSAQNDAGESGNSNEAKAALHVVGVFLMNEGSGTTDENGVDGQLANFAGTTPPSWNPADPSIVFNGGGPQNSYLDAGLDTIFNGLTADVADPMNVPAWMTVVAKVNRTPGVAAGICEKNDGINSDSGFLFGWDSNGALALTVQRDQSNLRAAGGVVPSNQWVRVAFTWDSGLVDARLFVGDFDTTQPISPGSGTPRSAGAVNQPFRIGTAGNLTNYAGEVMTASLNGKMAYLAIYKGSRTLTLEEIKQVDAFKPVP